MIAVALKWSDLRGAVDPITGVVHSEPRGYGFSAADEAALEAALTIAEAWRREGQPTSVVALTVSHDDPRAVLGEFGALGLAAARWVRVDSPPTSAGAAALLAEQIRQLTGPSLRLVLCGDYSTDNGSGSVPPMIGHALGLTTSCGWRAIDSSTLDRLGGVRRLDGGRRERLSVACPAVVSIEAGSIRLRRAPLGALLDHAPLETVEGRLSEPNRLAVSPVPFRPPTHRVDPPHPGAALDRIIELTGTSAPADPPRSLELSAQDAAVAILDQLIAWGYLGADPDS